MKLRSLKLERFGHFQGATLKFSDGLQLLWGRNEAGKSTLVAALRALLFKYPPGQYDFRFPDATLAISAQLQFADGSLAEVRREKNKGWKGKRDEENFPDEQFREKLGRPSQELFANVFAFGLEELARGSESIHEAGLGAAISGAGVGVGVAPDVLAAELKKRADELYSERASKRPINLLVGEIRDLKKELRQSELRGENFTALVESLANARAKATELRARRESLLKRSNLVDTALRALPAKQALAGARLALERLGPTAPLPAAAESEYQRLKSDRDRLAARLDELEAKIARARSELASLEELPASPIDARLSSLAEAWSGDVQRREQLEEARALREKLQQEKARIRARLNPPWHEGDGPLPVPRIEEVRRRKTQLDALSRKLEAAERDRERAARELSQAAEQAEKQAGEAPSADALQRLRGERDAQWDKVRKSWLEGALVGGEGSGELFEHLAKKQLAASYASAAQASDAYADELRRRATDVAAAAEAAARRDERSRALESADRELAQAKSAYSEGEEKWRALWERCGFLPHSPDAMIEWLGDHQSLLETAAELERASERATRLEQATEEYATALRAAVGEGEIGALYEEARRRLKLEAQREEERIRAAERKKHLLRSADELAQDQKQARAALEARQAELSSWRARAGVEDDAAFLAAAAAAAEAHELGKQIAQSERTLAEARAGVADLDEALARGREPLAAEKEDLDRERQQLEGELQDTDRRVGAAEVELRPWDGRSRAIELCALIEAKRAELRDQAAEWARLTAARSLLEKQLERFSTREQPRLLESIAKLFSAMTRGRYTRVYQRLDEKRTFMAVRADGVEVEPGALSSGTREQLYLAVRLAYVDSYCARSEPLPLCLDDVLVNFDDERAIATLDVLQHLAREGRTQLLFLTCHAHLVELAKKTLPSLRPLELPPAG
jgi:uncharacterized protein YhaN